MENSNVIGLSATAFNEDFGLEKDHLQGQGFKLYDSGLQGFIDPDTATTKANITEYFSQSDGYAKLVFAQGNAVETFTENAPHCSPMK